MKWHPWHAVMRQAEIRVMSAHRRTGKKIIHGAGSEVGRSNIHCLETGTLQDTFNRIKRCSRIRLSYVIDPGHERLLAPDSAISFAELLFCVSAYNAKSFSRRSVSFLNLRPMYIRSMISRSEEHTS